MKYRFIILYTALFFTTQVSLSQYYDTGQDPASLKWVQIKTGHFKVIYPEIYGQGGVDFAMSLDDAYARLGSLFPEKKFRIPVIIHNYTTNSNGYVAWAPRRMEIYPTPEQNTIPLDPFKQLSIHELAHVLQMESLNKGFSKGMSFVLGEQFYGVVAFLLPLWFLEGDAVFAETALTGSGRGRSPSFQKQMKAIAVERDRLYNYDKIINGSFRDFIPDHYQSGYQMVTWAMTRYDQQVWNKVLRRTAEEPFSINPVNISLSKSTGLTKKNLYRETFDSLKTIWTKDLANAQSPSYKQVNPVKNGKYINYYSPVNIGNDSILAVKTSLSRSPAFVLITQGGKSEKTILEPGQVYPYCISSGNGKLAWVETRNDPRWENREYSVIRVMDLKSNMISQLSKKSRYLSISVSPDGKYIAATENTVTNRNSLVLLDAETGDVLKSSVTPGNAYLQHPQWSDNGEKVTTISLTDVGEGVLAYDIISGLWEQLIEPGTDDLQSSCLKNDTLFFISSRSGTDNIYWMAPDKKTGGVTNSRYGTSDLSMSKGKITFSDYSILGNNICTVSASENLGIPAGSVSSSSFLINRFKAEKEVAGNLTPAIYTPEPYRKWQHLFNFHSWMPFYADIEQIRSDPAAVRPGLTLLTQNQLSTLISSVGYEYSADKRHLLHTRVTWKGLYPVLESQLDWGYYPVVAKLGEDVEDPSSTRAGTKFSNTLSVPLSFSSGKFYQYFRPSLTSDYRSNYIYIKEDGAYDYGQNIISGRIFFSNYHRYAWRDIYPRWAQTLDFNYSFAPFDKNIYGSEISLRTAFYFPGFFPGNGIKLSYEKEKQAPEKYLLGSRVSLPRGYENIISRDIDLLSVDFVMPLLYPDLNIASLLYIKRIRTSLFVDYARGKGNTYYENTLQGLKPTEFRDYRETFRSSGFELMTDFHLFRIPYMISCGIQSSWKRADGVPVVSFLLNIDMFGMSISRKRIQ